MQKQTTRIIACYARVMGCALAMLSAVVAAGSEKLDLAGEWRLCLDAQDRGIQANWATAPLPGNDRISLPNTTDRAGFGFALDTNTMLHAVTFPTTTRFPGVKEPSRADEHGYLVRRHLFVGPAWYQREVQIPQSWKGRLGVLRLERALWQTEVWWDDRRIGTCDSLVGEHRHELGPLQPGRHRLTVRVDNRMIHNLSTVTHAYGPETQTRWNGLIGGLTLEVTPLVSIRSVRVFPADDRRSARISVSVQNAGSTPMNRSVWAQMRPEHETTLLASKVAQIACAPGLTTNELTLTFATPAAAWDEFHPTRYRLDVTLGDMATGLDEASAFFGFRHVERVGNELRLNGRPIFLRGTLDCAVYPRTGHPPMTVPEWERVLSVIKEYGFNHVRYHTWCPPEAAFEAADRLGLYLQPEAPAWVDDWGTSTVTKPQGIGRDREVVEFLRAELRRMSECYGNHPSFLLCSIGNEFGMRSTDWDRVNAMVEEIKTLDPRRLYTGCGARRHLPADDFWFTHDSGAGTRGVGPARTDWDFSKAAEASPVPLIAHETGQRPVFPDYDVLLPKFTGPLLPLNLKRYQAALAAAGLDGQIKDFVRASAQFQLVQYKAEHEAMLRTRGYAGYQLLMLNDFTGQSEALVGLLDPFWESKRIISPFEVRAWNSPTVLLARFPKYTWTSDERFEAAIEVAHFGESSMRGVAWVWSIENQARQVFDRGTHTAKEIPTGVVTSLGRLRFPLKNVTNATALTFRLRLGSTENRWNLWVYPAGPEEPEPTGVLVANTLDDSALQRLREGGKVLLLGHGLKRHAARTGFESVYWSAGWWGNKFSSLGVMCDPRHPALAFFPNEGWSDWQWRDLCAGATTFDLEGAPRGFRPIVQPVPDFHFNTLLAQVFEARVAGGSLLVCGYDLSSNLAQRPGARQFRRSLFRYTASADFRPTQELPLSWVEGRFLPTGLTRQGAKVLRVDSEDRANGNIAANVLDGDPATFWHSRWQPATDPMPHELVIDLGAAKMVPGVTCWPRQDQSNGRIAEAEIFGATELEAWGEVLAQVRWTNSGEAQSVRFPKPVKIRYLRIVVKSEVNRNPFAALAEIDLLASKE